MRRARTKTALRALASALILALLLSLCACSPKHDDARPDTGPMHGPELFPEEFSQGIVRNSLTIVTRKTEIDGTKVSCPYVCNSDMELLNVSIRSEIAAFIADSEAENASVTCTVEFNRCGLLSLLAVCELPDGRVVNTDTLNFDCDTGMRIALGDCFGSTDSDYVSDIEGILSRWIDSNGYTVIGSGPVIDDSTLFLFAYDGLWLVFREYELLSYDAGSPRVKVRLVNVSGHIAPDGLLNRLK